CGWRGLAGALLQGRPAAFGEQAVGVVVGADLVELCDVLAEQGLGRDVVFAFEPGEVEVDAAVGERAHDVPRLAYPADDGVVVGGIGPDTVHAHVESRPAVWVGAVVATDPVD